MRIVKLGILAAVAACTLAVTAPANAATAPVYGDTLDNAAYGNYNKVVSGSQTALGFGRRLTHRIVFDRTATLSDYSAPINALAPVSDLVGTFLDSSEMSAVTTAQYGTRVDTLLSMYPTQVKTWEVGNEINGEWLGSNAAAKAYLAWQKVHAAGKLSLLTPYLNGNWDNGTSCWSTRANEMLTWLQANIVTPHPDMAASLDYVLPSYYEGDCNNHRVTQAELDRIMGQLHTMFPNAGLGFGEAGLASAVTSSNLTKAQGILTYYYGLKPTDPAVRATYVTGGFWWYGQEDLYPTATKPLWNTFKTAILAY